MRERESYSMVNYSKQFWSRCFLRGWRFTSMGKVQAYSLPGGRHYNFFLTLYIIEKVVKKSGMSRDLNNLNLAFEKVSNQYLATLLKATGLKILVKEVSKDGISSIV